MTTFYTPSGYSGSAELTADSGLIIQEQGLWRYRQNGYNDGATFGLSLTFPPPSAGGLLHLTATNWNIAVVGNQLTEYIDPDTSQVYPASTCRISVTGQWVVIRQPNSNSWNSIGVEWYGKTSTDRGEREMTPYLLNFTSPKSTYLIQGADVNGGALDTFSTYEFFCRIVESTQGKNSNKEYQSNTISRPVWAYTYSKSWQI